MPENCVEYSALVDSIAGPFCMGIGNVSYVIARELGVRGVTDVARKMGVTRSAVYRWNEGGKLPPKKALALHFDHGVPWEVLKPLVEGRA